MNLYDIHKIKYGREVRMKNTATFNNIMIIFCVD